MQTEKGTNKIVFFNNRNNKATRNKKENSSATCLKKLSHKFDMSLNKEWNYDAE